MPISFPSNPVNGQTSTFNGVLYTYFSSKNYWKSSKILWTGTSSTVTFTTGSLALNATYTGSSQFSNAYLINQVTTSHAAWVRVYASNAGMIADASRSINQDPDISTGVLLEIISDGNEIYYPEPSTYCSNSDSPITETVYVRITNLSTTASITVDLALVKMGA